MSEEVKPDRTLDALGLYCPIPVFRAKGEMDKLASGQILEVLADDPAAEEDIQRWSKRLGHRVLKVEKRGQMIRFLVKKG